MSIADELEMMHRIGESGGAMDLHHFDLLAKAFRLREYHHCPRCDNPNIHVEEDLTYLCWKMRCSTAGCEWADTLSHKALAVSEQALVEVAARA